MSTVEPPPGANEAPAPAGQTRTVWTVRYETVSPRNITQPWIWRDAGELSESDARMVYNNLMTKGNNHIRNPQLIERTELSVVVPE